MKEALRVFNFARLFQMNSQPVVVSVRRCGSVFIVTFPKSAKPIASYRNVGCDCGDKRVVDVELHIPGSQVRHDRERSRVPCVHRNARIHDSLKSIAATADTLNGSVGC